MNKKYIAYFFSVFILSILFAGCGYSKNPSVNNIDSQVDNSSNKTVIYVDPILKDDVTNRLENFINENISPITITSSIENSNYDIAIFGNSKSLEEDESNTELVYSKLVELSPQQIEYFNNQTPRFNIKTHIKNNTQITLALKKILKDSYDKTPPKENKLIFTGCILPSRWVALRAQQHDDYTYPFKYTADITKNSDLTIGNLETPFAETGPYTELGMVFRGDPGLVEGLVYSGFDVVNLANNHLGDSQRAGMEYTFNLLDANDISYYGAGKNEESSKEPLIKEINGIRYSFLGYADTAFTPVSYASGPDYAGLNIMDEENLISDLERVKDKADFIIVSMHAGTEYTYNPNAKQISFAHKAIENGANMVYGHHPHVVQAIEYYQGKPIFYSPGNFSMDQLERNTQQGFIIELKTIFDQVTSINLIPYHIYDYSQPKPVEREEAEEIFDNVIGASKILNNEK